jgi:hypothetical protein
MNAGYLCLTNISYFWQPKDEKPEEFKKQAQIVSTVDLDNAKKNDEHSNDVTTDLGTAERSGEQSDEVATDIDTTKRSEEEANKVAADLDTSKRSEEQSDKVAMNVDLVQPGEAQSRPAVLLGHADDTEDGRT